MVHQLIIESTLRCNLRCKHCLNGYPKERPDFPLDLLSRLLEQARPFNARHVVLTGGEPCLHPQFEQMVSMIVEAGYTWHFVSNGWSAEAYGPLMERYREKLTHVSLSLDGANAMTHDDIRNRNGSFERVTAAIRRYVAGKFPVHVIVTLNKKNQEQALALIQLARELGACRINFAGMIPTPWNKDFALSDTETYRSYQQILHQRQPAGLQIRVVSGLLASGGVHFCNALSLVQLAFTAKGELAFCCDTEESDALIGSLIEQPLSALITTWLHRSADLQAYRVKCIAAGQIGEGFNTCVFCNDYFTHLAFSAATDQE